MKYYLHDGFLGHEPNGEYNSLGHRCREISEINLQNYILFACENLGTSLDLPLEKTFPYILAEKLNTDYYNLSLFRGGVDSVKFNLLSWLSRIKQKPRAIVISCEFINSFLVTELNSDTFSPCEYDDESIKDLFHYGNYTGYFNFKNELIQYQINSLVNLPIYQIIYKDRSPILTKNTIDILVDNTQPDHVELASKIETHFLNIKQKVRP